ncbi:hypothetical protein [Rhodospirillum sp. A1_3_36]|uniref:hypothetical protein n=1 Tax=Rhodospirillum sp. A1_3_36 TaxID=3391666 RepID=UPI0039A4A7EE
MVTDSEVMPLGDSASDRVTRTLSTLVGRIPMLGWMMQVAIAEVIPNIRLQRIEAYLLHLDQRIDQVKFKAALEQPEGLDLFEEGLWQSARALDDDRKRYIAELIAKGMAESSAKQEQTRHFLRLLGQIGDSQIIILTSYLSQFGSLGGEETAAFYERHRDVLGPFSREIGSNNPDAGRAEHKDALERHLSSLGLLDVASEDLGGLAGSPGASVTYRITPQGSQFLQYIGVSLA